MEEHWFDALNRVLVRRAPRRAALGASTSLAAGLSLVPPWGTEAARDPCARRFKTKEDRRFCRRKRRRCWKAGTAFCIHAPDAEHPDLHATCCPRGQACCRRRCADLETDPEHCGRCGNACDPTELCLDGRCVEAAPPRCPEGQAFCRTYAGGAYGDPYACVDTTTDRYHCGGCEQPCPGGWVCGCNGRCMIPDQHVCCPDGDQVCNGNFQVCCQTANGSYACCAQ